MNKNIVMNDIKRIGERYKHKVTGQEYEIIEYLGNKKVKVRFDDGYENWYMYHHIIAGKINNPNYTSYDKYIEKLIGTSYYHEISNQFFTIIDYTNKNYVTIQFDDELIKRVQLFDINNNKVTHPEFTYINSLNKKKFYPLWNAIKHRTITNKIKHNYLDVKICDEWLEFENFNNWCENNYIEGFQIDKDLLTLNNNKIYSPETCCFLPPILNAQFIKRPKNLTNSLGITEVNNSFKVTFLNKYIGYFPTKLEATNIYLELKLNYIKDLSLEYKDKLNTNIFNKLQSLTIQDLNKYYNEHKY